VTVIILKILDCAGIIPVTSAQTALADTLSRLSGQGDGSGPARAWGAPSDA